MVTLPSPALRPGSIKVKRSAEAAGIGVSAEPGDRVSEGEEDKENTGPIPLEKRRREEVHVCVYVYMWGYSVNNH